MIGISSIGPDGTLYAGSDGELLAISAAGSLEWSAVTSAGISAIGADGTLYGSDGSHRLYAISPDGDPKWSFDTGGYGLSSPALGADGAIYFSGGDGYFYALNPDGTVKWQSEDKGFDGHSPAIGADGTVYVGNMVGFNVGTLYAFGQ